MIENTLESMSVLLHDNLWFSPIIALLAGILTSVTPCSLSGVPLIIAYVGGAGHKDTKRAFGLSVTFSLGTAASFTALGILASAAGKLMVASGKWVYIILGILLAMMALQTWDIICIIPSSNLLSKSKSKGYTGAFIAGILGGLFSSPCATPVLIALLGILAKDSNILWGSLLMICYSLGHSILIIAAGTSFGFVQKLNESESYSKSGKILKAVMGTAILLTAFYMLYLGF